MVVNKNPELRKGAGYRYRKYSIWIEVFRCEV
jgi:hypothetical protein